MLLLDNFIHADLHPGNIMVKFYKPEQLNLWEEIMSSWPFNLLTTTPTPDPAAIPEKSDNDAAHLRLLPHIHDQQPWLSELASLEIDSYQPQLIFIDTGLVTELSRHNRKNFIDMFCALAEFDGYRTGWIMIDRCTTPWMVVEPEVFALKMQHLILKVKAKTFALGQVKIGELIGEAMGMVRKHRVRMEGEFVNVIIGILLLEGIGRHLDPDMDIFKA